MISRSLRLSPLGVLHLSLLRPCRHPALRQRVKQARVRIHELGRVSDSSGLRNALGIRLGDQGHVGGQDALKGRRDEVASLVEPLCEGLRELDRGGLARLGCDGYLDVVGGYVLLR